MSIGPDDEPTGLDLFGVAPQEGDLGWNVSAPEQVRALVAALPFEHTMLVLAQLEAAWWHVRNDPAGQLGLAQSLFGPEAYIAGYLERWLAEEEPGERRFVFDERHFAILRALLVQEAGDTGQLDPERFARALYATSAFVEQGSGAPESPTGLVDWLGFFARSGAYYASRSPLHTLALAYALWIDHAQRMDMRAHSNFCEVGRWLRDASGFDAREQLALGVLAVGAAQLLDNNADVAARSVLAADWLRKSALAGRENDLRGLAVADRAWYREQLADLADDALTWERTPFEQRPLLALEHGPFLVTSPHAIWSWLGQGLYFRALDIARDRSELDRLTGFYGQITERYIFELIESTIASDAGSVYPDELSGPKKHRVRTPDVAVDLCEDVVLMEVVSGRLTYETRVTGDANALARDLVKLVDHKLEQLSQVPGGGVGVCRSGRR